MSGAVASSKRASAMFRDWWLKADRVLIGAGAGLSAAAGIDYTDTEDFARTFPVLARAGFSARYQLIGYWRWSAARHWAYWSTHVSSIRFGPRRHPVYTRLRELIAEKDAFVLTSNVDAMFERNGFDPTRIATPQGDYGAFQCRRPCRPVAWPNQPEIERLVSGIDPDRFEVADPALIPRCPSCGGEVFLNVRVDGAFVETPYRKAMKRLAEWLRDAEGASLLLVEIGAGFNTPSVVRWPMEQIAMRHPGARLVRINRDHAALPDEVAGRAISLQMDAHQAVEALWRSCVGT